MNPQELTVRASDGYEVPLEVFESPTPKARLLLLPALGIQARLYRRLGALLADSGISVMALEQRGHGRSALRPARDCDFGFREWLQADIPAALDWLHARVPRAPVFLAGHSLGGHLALMARALYPQRVSGVVLLTTATPYHGCYHGVTRLQVWFLIAVVPLLTAVLGYYPGHRLGFGGREARRLMADWLVMARENRYSARGLESEEIEGRVQSSDGPVLSIHCDRDDLAPLSAIDGVTRRLKGSVVDRFEISSDALGSRADHLSWARQPAIAAGAIERWISAQIRQ
ncbi:MAG: alpha/beta fold hydrolase [Steroidobacteraceae bacterium]|nr:alpha/beta fold hydrolase [Steroidobacteraceae bacterium]